MTNTCTVETQNQIVDQAIIKDGVPIHQTEKAQLKPIGAIKEKLAPIKDKLKILIEASANNSSLLSRAAQFWKERPLWQKITAGAVLSLPLLVIGILANLVSLITISIVTALAFTGCSLLLDNHQTQMTQSSETMVEVTSSLSEVIEAVFSALDDLRQQLATDIDTFEKENERLSHSIAQLDHQNSSLTKEIARLIETQKGLRATQEELHLNNINFVQTLQKQSHLFNDVQQELEVAKSAYKENTARLSGEIFDLKSINRLIEQDLEQARSIGLVLRSTVDTLSKVVILDNVQREAFQLRLNEFLTNKSKSFDQIAERICEAEEKLTLVTQELERSNQQYQALLEQQEQHIIRLEHLDEPQLSNQAKQTSTRALENFGLYACDKTMVPPLQEQCSNTITQAITSH